VDAVLGHQLRLRAKEVLVVNRAADGGVHLRAVIDEVRQLQFLAVQALALAGQAEPDMPLADAGAAVEVMAGQPAQGTRLNPGTAFGHQPHPAAEQAAQAGDRRHAAVHFGCGEQRGLVSLEERGVAAPRVGRAADDDPADIDAEAGLAAGRNGAHVSSMTFAT
jgi:hypothetical protein